MKTSTLTTQLYPSYAPPEKWRMNLKLADNDMYDRWEDYHERMLRPAYGEDIETAITLDLDDALYEQVKARVLA